MKATVTLKEGKSYTWGPHVFSRSPSFVSDRDTIEQLKRIGVLSVVVSEDEPIAPPPGVELESGEEMEGDPETPPMPPARKPAAAPKPVAKPKVALNKGQFKPAKPAPAAEPPKE